MKTRKLGYLILLTLAGTGGISQLAQAEDYAAMSTEDLMQMRDQAGDMTNEQLQGFRNEVQMRMRNMSDDERALYQKMNGQGGQGAGGNGQQHRYGQNNDQGKGQQHRYRHGQGGNSGYGSGYASRQGGGGGYGRGRRGQH